MKNNDDAARRLAASRQAILEHIARRQRRHDPREFARAQARTEEPHDLGDDGPAWQEDIPQGEPPPPGSGWFDHVQHAVRTWWRYHPAHMVVDLAAPLLHDYARRKPVQLLAISAAAGAALTFTKPWKLISLTTLAVAIVKSSHLPGLLMAALSAADYRKDHEGPG